MGIIGRSDRIRTYDPCLPKAVLYQTELHSDRCWLNALELSFSGEASERLQGIFI